MNIIRKNDVAIYYSKPSKIEMSLEEQKERLKKYCNHFGLTIVKEYIEIDNVNKPLFKQMIEDIKNKTFNIVLSYNFDTLTKNDEDLYRLVNELNLFDYELQLESSYIYTPILKLIFKLERDDNEKKRIREEKEKKKREKKEKGLNKTYCRFVQEEVKNPTSTEPYNWVELIDNDKFRFEEEPLFDSDGTFLGFRRDVFVIFNRISGVCRTKKWKEECEKKQKIKEKAIPQKLFEPINNIEEIAKKEV